MLLPRSTAPLLMALAAAGSLAAQNIPRGVFRGTVVGYEGTAAAGRLRVVNSAGEEFQCAYDSYSWLEMQRQRITVAKLEPGDPVEVLADNPPGSTDCYVHSVRVGPPPSPRAKQKAQEARSLKRTDPLPRASVTISGVVIRLDQGSLTLRTREGEETILLRRDTRYYGDGRSLTREDVAVNLRVAVRAGRTLFGGLEALQVSWGRLVTAP